MNVKEAKALQGYTAQPVLPVCGTCQSFSSEKLLDRYYVERNAYYEKIGAPQRYTAETHGTEKNLRCSAGGFAVKKMATCRQWQANYNGGAA